MSARIKSITTGYLLPLLVLLSAGCKKSNTTPSQPENREYFNFRVKNITITAMPFADANGINWDPFDGPDVYFNVENIDGGIYYSGSGMQRNNVATADMPLSWNLATVYNINNLGSTQYLTVYDYDALDPNDPVGYVAFTLNEHKSGYPKSITKTARKLTITINGEWY